MSCPHLISSTLTTRTVGICSGGTSFLVSLCMFMNTNGFTGGAISVNCSDTTYVLLEKSRFQDCFSVSHGGAVCVTRYGKCDTLRNCFYRCYSTSAIAIHQYGQAFYLQSATSISPDLSFSSSLSHSLHTAQPISDSKTFEDAKRVSASTVSDYNSALSCPNSFEGRYAVFYMRQGIQRFNNCNVSHCNVYFYDSVFFHYAESFVTSMCTHAHNRLGIVIHMNEVETGQVFDTNIVNNTLVNTDYTVFYDVTRGVKAHLVNVFVVDNKNFTGLTNTPLASTRGCVFFGNTFMDDDIPDSIRPGDSIETLTFPNLNTWVCDGVDTTLIFSHYLPHKACVNSLLNILVSALILA